MWICAVWLYVDLDRNGRLDEYTWNNFTHLYIHANWVKGAECLASACAVLMSRLIFSVCAFVSWEIQTSASDCPDAFCRFSKHFMLYSWHSETSCFWIEWSFNWSVPVIHIFRLYFAAANTLHVLQCISCVASSKYSQSRVLPYL